MNEPQTDPSVLWKLLGVYAPLSFVTIGGGQSIIADVNRQVVDVHHWMTQSEFLDAFAISRMAPGPGSLLATLVGWHVAGFSGAVVATLATFGPTAFLIYAIAHVWSRHRDARWKIAIETGLRPVAAGTVLASTLVLMQAMNGGLLAWIVAILSTGVLLAARISPLLLIAGGAVAFVALNYAA